jgi:hypothetical protein
MPAMNLRGHREGCCFCVLYCCMLSLKWWSPLNVARRPMTPVRKAVQESVIQPLSVFPGKQQRKVRVDLRAGGPFAVEGRFWIVTLW